MNWLCLGATTGYVCGTEESLMKQMKRGESRQQDMPRFAMRSQYVNSLETEENLRIDNGKTNEMRSQ